MRKQMGFLLGMLLLALVATGCESGYFTTSTPPEGVSVMESRGKAVVTIKSDRWSQESTSVQMDAGGWRIVLHPLAASGQETKVVKLSLDPYEDLEVSFTDAAGKVVRSQSLTRREQEAESPSPTP